MPYRGLAAILVPVLLSLSLSAQQATVPAADRTVLLISLDGFPAAAFDDARLPVPTLRRLMREGASASAMRPVNPVVTWPNHTTFVTGVTPAEHGVLYNGVLLRQGSSRAPRVEPWRDKREMVRGPTLYDRAHEAGLTTGEVDWVAVQKPGTITWSFPERPTAGGPVEQAMVAARVIGAEDLENFNTKSSGPWRDQRWTDAAVYILRTHAPNFLMVHLLNLDSTHHRYGPGTLAGTTAMALLDAQVERIVAAAEAVRPGRTTVVVVSDHGFAAARRHIRPNAVLREMGHIAGTVSDASAVASAYSWGGTATIFVNDPAQKAALLPAITARFVDLEGVARVMRPNEYHELGLPTPEENPQMGDLLLIAAEGYGFSGASTGPPVAEADPAHLGHHGWLASEPAMGAIFIAWGYGIREGVRLPVISSLRVAPTLAALLGVPLPRAKEPPLSEILTEAVQAASASP